MLCAPTPSFMFTMWRYMTGYALGWVIARKAAEMAFERQRLNAKDVDQRWERDPDSCGSRGAL